MIEVRVSRLELCAEGVMAVDLVSATPEPLPAFSAGAHVDVELPGGLVRQYSLCNDPGEPHRYRLAVLREAASRGGSSAVHDALDVGANLRISPPRNHFALIEQGPCAVLLAGGIGITPLLAMAYRLKSLGLPFELHYFARSRATAAFVDEIEQGTLGSDFRFYGADGPRPSLDALVESAGDGGDLYVCGPARFIDAVLDAGRRRGLPEGRMHTERFVGTASPSEGDRPFRIRLASDGRVVEVAADQTAADALEAAGVFVPTSCGEGVCGTCVTSVIEGVPDHRDVFQTASERAANRCFTPCCSRAFSDELVLEL